MEGAQVVTRVSLLLRLLARHGSAGARLLDLARAANLNQPTTRRLLKALVVERLVAQHHRGGRYFLGPLASELGMAAHLQITVTNACKKLMRRLAEQTECLIALQHCAGEDTVCIHSVAPKSFEPADVLVTGDRRPLGGGAGPLAILAQMEDSQISSIMEVASPELYFETGDNLRDIHQKIDTTRQRGYAVCPELFVQSLIGVALILPSPSHFASLSVIGEGQHATQLVALMNKEIEALQLTGGFFKEAGLKR